MKTRLGLLLVSAMASFLLTGCPGLGCGVGPGANANVVNGTVTFDPVLVGSSEQLSIPFQDSASNTSETILGVTITGPDAADFTVLTPFPVDVPANEQATLEIQFAPTHSGSAAATLTLNTQGMGPSPVQLTGTGESQ